MDSQIKKIESTNTGQIVYTIPTAGEGLEWEIVKEENLVELTDQENLIAKAKQLDAKKFLLVKQLLLAGKSYSQIRKKTGIAKTTIINYKKYYSQATLALFKKGKA
ncbi:hypothetical protein [Aureispira anguillae]|uniref:hypothetical protein n=1 Tax=Aureispira anguillae TaxID=2864201 RepID=UPI00222EEE26|nr:hypothetical protein [Aureispira anguillae]